jgi:hypothetical protein
VTISIPKEGRHRFEKLVSSLEGCPTDVRFWYTIRDVREHTISIKSDDIRKAMTQHQAFSAGRAYVSAKDIQDVLKEARVGFSILEIKDLDATLIDSNLRTYFETLLKRLQETLISGRQAADNLDKQISSMSGIRLDNHIPITLTLQLIEEIDRIDDHQRANKLIDEFLEHNKEALEASGGLKGLSVGPLTLGASASYRTDQEHKEYRHFQDDEALHDFKKHYIKREGPEIQIVARGLDLVERSAFDAFMDGLARVSSVDASLRVNSHLVPTAISTRRARHDIYVATLPFDKEGGSE